MPRQFSGQLVKQRRQQAGLKPEQLALTVGRSVFAIHQYERGTSRPTAPVLGALADALGCTVDDFYTNSDQAVAL